MTKERIKSISILAATLLFGILLGLMVPGFIHKLNNHRDGRGTRMERPMAAKGDWFVKTLYRVVKPDSTQREKIKPVADWAAARMDSLEQSMNSEAAAILDSAKAQLRPILNDEQWARLEKFNGEAREKWGRHRGRH